ncbi:hypothetical protein HYALB_00011198 [Hymenoscyphus albidus]|uniref:D-isomer specific 2-hydroxyacid dehydrogenase NAD-binding domain-containing protein n=1 Tax=Hymenoscyphus albidus TaxID=595503 RepID=A0A9N9LWT4_9HELO|nr:hypothetical protein HYALB_00011198 [Hymenoscyphus albidus]
MPPPLSRIKVAILDDYPNIAPPIFSHLSPNFTFTSFPDTLPPYNHPSTTPSQKQELIERLKPFPVISCMRERTPFPAELLRELPNLKLLMTTGRRNLGIDGEEARRLSIDVTGTSSGRRAHGSKTEKGVVDKKDGEKSRKSGPDSTTQHTISLILGLAKNLADDNTSIRTGGWQTGLSTGLAGKTLGLVGLGKLGVAVGRIMHLAFGMRVLAWSQNLTQERADEAAVSAGLSVVDEEIGGKTFTVVSKETLFRESDVISIHVVLSDRSRGVITLSDLELMKGSALFVNTSRGPIVDEDALLIILERGAIRGAALDVFELSPLPQDSRWRTTEWGKEGRARVLLTPHTGYVEGEGMKGWYGEQAGVLGDWERGVVRGLLNEGVGRRVGGRL